MKKAILLWITGLLVICLFNSCGARKTQNNKKEEKLETDFTGLFRNSGNSVEFLNMDSNLQTNFKSNLNLSTDRAEDELTIEPSDPSKPAIYIDPNGNKYSLQNAKLTSKKSKQASKEISGNSGNSLEILKSDYQKRRDEINTLDLKTNAKASVVEKDKVTSKESSIWNFLWFFIPLSLIGVIVLAIKKFKNKIPV